MGAILLRTLILYAAIIFALRIMGKRQIGELEPSELVVTLIISNIATLSIEDTNVPLLESLLPIFTLVACEVAMSILIIKSPKLRKLIAGSPCVVVRDGMIDKRVMDELRWSAQELKEQLRANGVFDIGEVKIAIVETNGKLSIKLGRGKKQ